MNFEKIKEIIVENIGCEESEVTLEANLIEDLKVDSLDIVELSMALEDEFGVTIEDSDFTELKTVKDIVDYLEKKSA